MSKSTEDSWKDLAQASKGRATNAGLTVQRMIARMNELRPFSQATGILDNGCGAGSIISYIIDTYGGEISESATLLAGDFSQSMLDVLQDTKMAKTAEANDIWDRLRVQRLDAHDLDGIEDASLSHVTGGHMYFLLPDPRKALRATHRVLDADGVIALTSGKYSQHIDALCSAVEHIRPGTRLELLREPWKSESGVKGELEATGFKDVETFVVETDMAYDDHRKFAEMLMVMPVMREATEGYSEEEQTQLLEQVVTNLREMNPAEPGTLRGASIVAFARKSS